jgi:hypothetical protein
VILSQHQNDGKEGKTGSWWEEARMTGRDCHTVEPVLKEPAMGMILFRIKFRNFIRDLMSTSTGKTRKTL